MFLMYATTTWLSNSTNIDTNDFTTRVAVNIYREFMCIFCSYEPYSCASFTTEFHEATDNTAITLSGWEITQQLGSINNRQMGDGYYERLSKFLCQSTSSRNTGKILCTAKH